MEKNAEQNAFKIVEILKLDKLLCLTLLDSKDLKCNILCQAANDQFSNDLEKLKALDIYRNRIFELLR